jgi:hypothetical protein
MYKRWTDFLWPLAATLLALLVVPLAIEQYPEFLKENRWPLPVSAICVLFCWVLPFFIHDRSQRIYAWVVGRGWIIKTVAGASAVFLFVALLWGCWKLFRFHSAHLDATLHKRESPKEQKPEEPKRQSEETHKDATRPTESAKPQLRSNLQFGDPQIMQPMNSGNKSWTRADLRNAKYFACEIPVTNVPGKRIASAEGIKARATFSISGAQPMTHLVPWEGQSSFDADLAPGETKSIVVLASTRLAPGGDAWSWQFTDIDGTTELGIPTEGEKAQGTLTVDLVSKDGTFPRSRRFYWSVVTSGTQKVLFVSKQQPGQLSEAKVGGIKTGDCSNVQIGGSGNSATTNCGPPPLKLEYSFQTLKNGEQGSFNFPSECRVRSHMRIVPNQSVPPPIRVALDFDHPISQIATTIEDVGAIMGGGPYRVGLHAISSPVSPGIGPHNPLIVEVCSEIDVQLAGEPHLVN